MGGLLSLNKNAIDRTSWIPIARNAKPKFVRSCGTAVDVRVRRASDFEVRTQLMQLLMEVYRV